MNRIVLSHWQPCEWLNHLEYWSRYDILTGSETATVYSNDKGKTWKAYRLSSEYEHLDYKESFATCVECMRFIDSKLIEMDMKLLANGDETERLSLLP